MVAHQTLDFTNDSSKILAAIGKLNVHLRVSESGVAICPHISSYQAHLIVNGDMQALHAAVDEMKGCGKSIVHTSPMIAADPRDNTQIAVREQADATWQQAKLASEASLAAIRDAVNRLAQMQGDRMLLLASSGFLSGDLGSEQDGIIATALHAQVVINALDAKGLYADSTRSPSEVIDFHQVLPVSVISFEGTTAGEKQKAAEDAMANLAASTGGLFFHDNNDLDFGFYRLGIVPEVRYELGFSPENAKADGAYHPLKVRLTNATNYSVESRAGYFAPTLQENQRKTPEQEIDQEVAAADNITGIPATVSSRVQGQPNGQNDLVINVHIDLKPLQFQAQKDRKVQQLTFILALFDSAGQFVTAKEWEMDLALKQDSFEQLERNGINAEIVLDARPGPYRLRAVARDAVEG